ncbi:NusG antitermination factor [Methylobacterium sp. 4-46]|uniref:transcription termination/antitermination protein NusG n=1 Tax=unclassified Methylobacterium TaxID=2615210 RepID=UPI000165CB73|nr:MULTISPECIES: antitermination factor NusG [Methylobacterium]ACA20232.1 NusG antitermination factor [Methylobacterium sp. 4-46]WFT79409.1 antitermination protein NusG [Methylobacterium nodulans]
MSRASQKRRRVCRRRRAALAHDRPPAAAPEAIRRRRRRHRPPRILVAPDRVWLVARTRPRWAPRVVRDLAALGLCAFEAREEVERVGPDGARRRVAVPLLHRLVFLGLRDDADLARAEAHPGVLRVLFREGRAVTIPAPILQAFADALAGRAGEGEDEAVEAVLLALGDAVRVTRGPLAALRGTIEAVDPARRRYRVALGLFGRATRVDLAAEEVAPDEGAAPGP